MADPFGRALLDHHRDRRAGPLRQRDGDETKVHPIEEYYFAPFTGEAGREAWLAERVAGPLLDLGAGAGRHALYFQDRTETVALERSRPLVELLRDRGVDRVRHGDMFALGATVEPERFRSAIAIGTQVGLARSMAGLERFLSELARVTTADATAIVDLYDPTHGRAGDMLGYRSDPTPGLAFRAINYEYDGTVGRPLVFRLVSPDRLRAATTHTAWRVAGIRRSEGAGAYHYLAALRKG